MGEMREMNVRGLLINCSDYRCSHWIAIIADQWAVDRQAVGLKPRFTCQACGRKGADVRPNFHWEAEAPTGAFNIIRSGLHPFLDFEVNAPIFSTNESLSLPMISKLEELTLFIILRAGPDATAGAVQVRLSDAAKKEQSFGSVFTTLDRLCEKKLLKWRKGEPNGRRGGRAPRLYEITGPGKKALADSVRATQVAAGEALPWGALS
jgi:DNA-binding PadR family transcriptional regulator